VIVPSALPQTTVPARDLRAGRGFLPHPVTERLFQPIVDVLEVDGVVCVRVDTRTLVFDADEPVAVRGL